MSDIGVTLSQAVLQLVFSSLDASNDDSIDQDEFLGLFEPLLLNMTPQDDLGIITIPFYLYTLNFDSRIHGFRKT